MDITDVVRKMYNDRVDRYFKCTLGKRFSELYDFVKGKTDTNLGLADRFHQGYDDPLYFSNYRYMRTGFGMWLNDPWHHSPMVNGVPVGGSDEGDPIGWNINDARAVVESVSGWDTQGLASSDANYNKYHPYALLTTNAAFTQESSPSTKPVPLTNSESYWRVRGTTHSVHQAVFDLRQTPYEYERRNWRYTPPRTDSSNALCPNTSCSVHENGWTVGQLYQASQSFGGWPIPSTSSEFCAVCHTKMGAQHGVQYLDGDNILTVFYDPKFEPDPVITGVEVDTTGSWNPNAKHGFVVEYFNSILGRWRDLFNVEWDAITSKYVYPQWNGSSWISTSTTSLPAIFKGVEGSPRGTPKEASGASGAHFIATTAQKIRIRISEPSPVDMREPASGGKGCTVTSSQNKVVVASLSEPLPSYVGRTIFLATGSGAAVEGKVTECKAIGGGVELRVQAALSDTMDTCYLSWKEYVSKVTKFRVYGYPYTKGDLVITPPATMQPGFLRDGLNSMRLESWPSQIFDVRLIVGEGQTVDGVEAADQTDANFHWEVKKVLYDGVTFLKITRGSWVYDYNKNAVIVPSKYRDPDSGQYLPVWDLNEELYTSQTTQFAIQTRPSQIQVQYLTGVGVPVDVKVTAIGSGPSYQLEPDSVCNIVGETEAPQGLPPAITLITPMPPMGDSVKLKNRQGLRFPMKWQVYNHKPLIWDNTNNQNMLWLEGNELKAGQWSDSAVMDLYTGNKGWSVSDLGPNARIGGRVTGEVTMYGSPNTILSGDVYVYAKAVTTRSYNLPDGTSVTTKERTGGYRTGAIVFRLEVNGSVSGRRTGITTSIPQIKLYLRERDLNESI
jgi:hypothetical protein